MTADWLPKAPARPPFRRWRHWHPPALEGVDVAELSYIVVDEIVTPTCVLAVTEWPRVDRKGRVRFRLDARPHLVRVSVHELTRYLAKHRTGIRNKRREVRIGDVFAAVADTDQLPPPESEAEAHELGGSRLTPLTWLEPPVYDLTAPAREVAKIAQYSAVTPLLKPEEVKRLVKKGR
ncbi:MAG TPA: hypothetical protein VGQ15_08975 [Gaiellaceae bacterium]|jgi:hypothetical protein|nr:hypothetical protein [Gaiellaceae bacterium]